MERNILGRLLAVAWFPLNAPGIAKVFRGEDIPIALVIVGEMSILLLPENCELNNQLVEKLKSKIIQTEFSIMCTSNFLMLYKLF